MSKTTAKHNSLLYNKGLEQYLIFSQCEDKEHLINSFLLQRFDWDNKVIFEAGAGLGRFTDTYIDMCRFALLTDKSKRMIDYLKCKYHDKSVCILECDHKDIRKRIHGHFDTFLACFTLNYAYTDFRKRKTETSFLESVLPDDISQYIIIESNGIFNRNDSYMREYEGYLNLLNKRFKCETINTKFSFSNIQEAIMFSNLFFGQEVAGIVSEKSMLEIPDIVSIYYN